jgi:predicted O-methyltransferase YrrM
MANSFVAVVLFLQFATVTGVAIVYLRLRRMKGELMRFQESQANDSFGHIQQLLALRDQMHGLLSLSSTRGWAASPDFLLQIVRDAQLRKPRIILECSSGTSTLVLARVCQLNNCGHVYSLENDEHYAGLTRESLRLNKLDEWATVITAPLTPVCLGEKEWIWYSVASIPDQVDMLVVDGPPSTTQKLARYPALPLLAGRLTSHATVFLDDANRPDEREIVDRWQREYQMVQISSQPTEKGIAILRYNTDKSV